MMLSCGVKRAVLCHAGCLGNVWFRKGGCIGMLWDGLHHRQWTCTHEGLNIALEGRGMNETAT